MIRTVLLDLDDTLLDFHKAERAALTQTLCHLGLEPLPDTLELYSRINQAQWELLEQGIITRDEVKVRRYRLLFEELNADCSPQEAARFYESRLSVGHYFVEGAEELLDALAGKYRLYLVSNGTTAVQTSRIASAGIADRFCEIFLSQELGVCKPAAAFFDLCFSRIPDFRREETVIVGDSLTSDIQGGKNAGIRTIWFNPRGVSCSGPVPDYEIAALLELVPLLERL